MSCQLYELLFKIEPFLDSFYAYFSYIKTISSEQLWKITV